jgi:Ca2+-binding RTX toxin-like protein
MYGGSGADYFTAVGPAVMYGNGGNDELRGGAHDDQLFGGAGNDTIIGGLGSDTMYGGAGSDTLNYFEHINAVTVRLGHAGSDYGSAGEHDFAAADFENATGGNGNDILIGTDADNVLSGGSGNDYIEGRGGDDKLAGNAGADTLVGGAGNDTFDASDYDYNGAGDTKMPDIFRGGAGIDTVTYASANRSDRMSLSLDNIANDGLSGERDNLIDIENVTGGDGDDTIIGSDKGNVLRGGPSNVPDGGDNDFIYGLGGNDILIGGRGKDLLVGGDGDDVIWSVDGSSGDRIDGGAGFDRAAFDKDKDAVLNIEKFI